MLDTILIKRWRHGVTALVAALGLLAVAQPALAAPGHGQPVALPQGQTVNHDYFAAGSIVEVDGTVNGDVYAAGGQVVVNGTVNGDVLAAGGTVTIDGTVNGNVRAAGGNVIVDGHVGRNVSAAGGSIELTRHASIGGSVASAGGNLQDSSSIRGDVNVAVGQLTIGSDAHVGGAVTYWSNQAATIAGGAVAGSITHRIPPARHHGHGSSGFAGAVWAALYWLVVTYILAVLLDLWLPRYSQTVASVVRKRPWQLLGWGIVGIIVTPIVGVVVAITVVGIPLALSLGAVYAVTMLLAPVWVILAFREIFAARVPGVNRFIALLAVAVIYMLITLIPIAGALFIIITGTIGFGASLTAGYGLYRQLRHKNEL